MIPEAPIPFNTADEKARAAFRRLLLSKQLYQHGLDHSSQGGALNKMIAVHNFHNAIEIALRAIFLHYDIRAEKQLNIEFEVMLNEIDNHQAFRDKEIRLPYRQELRNLNQLRNLVQHHAVEPEAGTMEDWRVFTRRFLEQVCETYFGLRFDSLSPLDMIADTNLRELLKLSLSSIAEHDFKKSLILAKATFEWAIMGIFPGEESPTNFHIWSTFTDFGDLRKALEKVAHEIGKAKSYAALLSSGISLADYKRFESCTPSVNFLADGGPHALWNWDIEEGIAENARWVHDFVTTTIVRWQSLGLAPIVPSWGRQAAEKLIEEGGASLA